MKTSALSDIASLAKKENQAPSTKGKSGSAADADFNGSAQFNAAMDAQSLSGARVSSNSTAAGATNGVVTDVGGEFQVNTTTRGGQFYSSVATYPDGSFVVVWDDTSGVGDVSNGQIKAQRFNADGTKVGAEFRVNTTTNLDQRVPKVSVLANGDFVVVWEDQSKQGGDASGSSIKAQVYHADGTKVGAEFLVNTTTQGNQDSAAITALPNGGFVVTWEDDSHLSGDTSGASIKGQVFGPGGQKVGGEIPINTITKNDQTLVSVAALEGSNSGEFIATWNDESGQNNDGTRSGSIKAQIFNADGSKKGVEFLVDTKGVNFANNVPNVTGLANGGFVVTWEASANTVPGQTDNDDSSIQLQVFDANGNKKGVELQINTSGNEYQRAPVIRELSNGDLIVVWKDESEENGDTSGASIKAQLLDPNGNKIGGEFLVNTTTAGNQQFPTIDVLPNNGFIVTWTDESETGTDKDGDAVKAQIFSVGGGGIITGPGFTATNEHKSANEDNSVVVTAASLIADSMNPSGETLSLTSVGNAAHGTVKLVNGQITFVPDANFSGQAKFDYTLSDGQGHSSTATVSVDVAPVADAPSLSVTQISGGGGGGSAGTVTPVGGETQINTTTRGGQFFSSVAAYADGSYVVAWDDTSGLGDFSNGHITAQRFDASGHKVGGEFQVNTTTDLDQRVPQVAVLDTSNGTKGDFVVVWEDDSGEGGDASGSSIKGQRYHADGTKVGGEFLVNTSTAGNQNVASITALPNGGFVVTWVDAGAAGSGSDGSGSSVKGQVFNPDGTKSGGEILINTITSGDQSLGAVTALKGSNSGEFLVTWNDESGLDNDGTRSGSIKAQLFNADGSKKGSEFLVDTKGINFANNVASATGLANGGFVVTWEASANTVPGQTDNDDSSIQLQIFDANGNKRGVELQINTSGNEYQRAPVVRELGNGDLIVVWKDESEENGDTDGASIKGQLLDANGNKIGGEFLINTTTAGNQLFPTIDVLPNSGFIVTWTDESETGGDKDGDAVKSQAFTVGNGGVVLSGAAKLNIAAGLTDTDGSETLSISVSGIPNGAILTDGVNRFTADEFNGSVDVSTWALNNLTFIAVPGFVGDLPLTVTATSTDHAVLSTGAATDSKTVSQTIDVAITQQHTIPSISQNIVGGAGNDVLLGGSGSDTLTGGGGNDTYQFGRGGGHDQIVNGTAASKTSSGELDFGAGVNANQLWFERNGNDLSILVMGTHDQVTIDGWFGGAGAQLKEITTADGMKIDAGVSQLIQAMASYSSAHAGFDPTTTTQTPGDAGLSTAIAANWHH
jgi:hypothetical protein